MNPIIAQLSWKQLPNPKAEQGNHTGQEVSQSWGHRDWSSGRVQHLAFAVSGTWVPDRKSCEDNRLQKSEKGSPWVCSRIPSCACVGRASMGLRKEQLPWKEQLRGAGRHFGPNQPQWRALKGHLECPIETPKMASHRRRANEGHQRKKFYWTALFWNHTNNA